MEEIILIGLTAIGFTILFTSLFSRPTTSFFIVTISVLSLHLLIPTQLPIEPGVTIHTADVFFIPLAIASTIRLLALRRISGLLLLWLIFSVYLLASFAQGVLGYGLLPAAASYRSSLYLSVGVLYFATFSFDINVAFRDLKWVGIAGIILALAAILLWVFPQWRPSDFSLRFTHIYERNRVLPAQAAFFLGLAAIASLPAWIDRNGSLLYRGLGMIALATAIALLHRTIWLSLAVAMLPSLIFSKGRAPHALLLIQMAVISLLVLWLFLAGLDMDFFSTSMVSAVQEATQDNNSTLDWRIQGWRILVKNAIASGPITILFGSGFGIGFERTMAFQYVTVSPHNYYIELFLTSGLIGCGLYILACLAALVRAIKLYRQDGHPIPLTLASIIVYLLVYGGAYTPQFDAALLLGLAMTLPAPARVSPLRAHNA